MPLKFEGRVISSLRCAFSLPTICLSLATQGAWNGMSLVGTSLWKTPPVPNSDRPPGGGHTHTQRAAGRGEESNLLDANAT